MALSELKSRIEQLQNNNTEKETSNQETIQNLLKTLENERKEREKDNTALHLEQEKQKKHYSRLTRVTLAVLVWIAFCASLISLNPWSNIGNQKIIPALLAISAILTQIIVFWSKKLKSLYLVGLIGFNLLGLIISGCVLFELKPNEIITIAGFACSILQALGAILQAIIQYRRE